MKRKLIPRIPVLLSVAFLMHITACKKNETLQNNVAIKVAQPKSEASKLRPIVQKTYSLKYKEVHQIVDDFTSKIRGLKNQSAKLVQSDSIRIDSLLWLVEATLNSEFDTGVEGHHENWRSDTMVVDIPTKPGSDYATSADIESAFLVLESSLQDSSESEFKLEFVDIEGYRTSANNLQLMAVAVKLNQFKASCPNFSFPNFGPFLPSTQYIAIDKIQYCLNGVYCSSPPQVGSITLPEAVTKLNSYRNCTSHSHDCSRSPHDIPSWINILNFPSYSIGYDPLNGTNPNPSYLWWSGIQNFFGTGNFWCSLSNVTLTGAQLNTFLNNQITFANNQYAYGPPNYFEPIDRYITSNRVIGAFYYDYGCNCYKVDAVGFWNVDLKIGTFICSNIN